MDVSSVKNNGSNSWVIGQGKIGIFKMKKYCEHTANDDRYNMKF
jgi:hypothetical protein